MQVTYVDTNFCVSTLIFDLLFYFIVILLTIEKSPMNLCILEMLCYGIFAILEILIQPPEHS